MPGEMARSDPRPSVRVTRGPGSGQRLASVLQERRENAKIDAGLGFIWRISDKMYRMSDEAKATIAMKLTIGRLYESLQYGSSDQLRSRARAADSNSTMGTLG
jgi:hypothetical protein